MKHLVEAIFPLKCIICGSDTKLINLCPKCENKINFFFKEVPSPKDHYYDSLFTIAAYEPPWLDIIHSFKYTKSRTADNIIKSTLYNVKGQFGDIDFIVCIPLFWRKYLTRNYNQSYIISKMLSNVIDKPVLKRCLVKGVNTKDQIGLDAKERRENLTNSFKIASTAIPLVKGRSILLIDDVYTTGSTLNECAKVLKKCKAGQVDVLTLAKTL